MSKRLYLVLLIAAMVRCNETDSAGEFGTPTASGGASTSSPATGGGPFGDAGGADAAGGWSAAGAESNGAAGGGAMTSGGSPGGSDAAEAPAFCETALQNAAAQYRGFIATYKDGEAIPRSVKDGETRFVPATDWTSGFVAGTLWYLYEATTDPEFRVAAERFTLPLASEQHDTGTHDVGFIINSSFGNALRLTGTPDYADVISTAATSLATRFNAVVGATRSWNSKRWSFPVIIDNMMNLELLFRAAELAQDTRLSDIAETHASTTDGNHFRDDSSSYHLVDFDPLTGAVLKRQTVQGISDDSAWARGQAWGLYGFTMAYRETRNPRFLVRATEIAEFIASHPNLPEDKVPFFDFSVPNAPDVPPLRDASAAAIIASALLELQSFSQSDRAERFRNLSLTMLETLGTPAYSARTGENGHFILMHSVDDYPGDSELDVAINYADYYYLEALVRCRKLSASAADQVDGPRDP